MKLLQFTKFLKICWLQSKACLGCLNEFNLCTSTFNLWPVLEGNTILSLIILMQFWETMVIPYG